MTPTRILRLSSLLALLQYGVHGALFLGAKPTHGGAERAVIDAMRSSAFDFGGFSRTYWDFYFGYGLLALVFGLVEVVLLWQLATLARAIELRRIAPTVVLLVVANCAHALVAWNYFFVAPIVGDALVTASLLWVLIAGRPLARPPR